MNTLFTVEKLSEVKALLRSAKEYDQETIIARITSDNNYSGVCYVSVTNRKGIKRSLRLELQYNNEVIADKYISIMDCNDLKDLEKEILSTIQKVLINSK